jgi:hypothetical protein
MARLGTLLSGYQVSTAVEEAAECSLPQTHFREHRVPEALACCRQYLESLQQLKVRNIIDTY